MTSGWTVLSLAAAAVALTLPLTAAVSATSDDVAAAAATAQATPVGDPERGRALYEQGRRADGRPLEALRPGLPTLRGAQAACVQCHRPSGLGDQEGRLRVPPITAASLFGPGRAWMVGRVPPGVQRERSRAESRPPYTPESLAAALADGVDGAGRALDPWMPRYGLSPAELADLSAWLAVLGPAGARQVRGLDGGVLHVASVVTPDATPARVEALDRLMPAWARTQRFGAVRLAWQRWTLSGPPGDWPAQLRALQAAQPAFALVSGAGGVSWAPVAAFCESQALPCVFPMVDGLLAREDGAGPDVLGSPYAVYFTDGVASEARLALRAAALLQAPPLALQAWIDDSRGDEAVRVLQTELERAQALADPQRPVPTLTVWDARRSADGPPAPAPARAPVLSWLSEATLATALADGRVALPPSLWLSSVVLPPGVVEGTPGLAGVWAHPGVSWLSVRAPQARFEATAALGLRPWLRAQGLPEDLSGSETADVYAACFYFADALQLTRSAWSAAHLMERLEAAVNNRPASGAYTRLSLGPGQRVAAQMGQVLGRAPAPARALVPRSPVLNVGE